MGKDMDTSKHTPTPWTTSEDHSWEVLTKTGEVIGEFYWMDGGGGYETRDANAAFIVRAVNSHEQMKTALQSILTLSSEDSTTDWNVALLQCKAAFESAEGGAQ